MSLLSRLESRFGRWAIPNLTVLIIAGQVLLYFLQFTRAGNGGEMAKIHLLPSAVMEGEVWRLFTFLFAPPASRSLLVIFYWVLMYMFGNGLEQQWGTFKYNLFLLVGYLASVAAAFIAYAFGYDMIADNSFLYGSLFLAFARLFPDFTINLYFVLPIKIKWLALLMWLWYAYEFLQGDWMGRMMIFASVLNYLLFFGKEHLRDWRQGSRRRRFESTVKSAAKAIQHECRVCGVNSETSPKTLFRYCSQCDGQCCYCPEHIREHEHVTA